jgi:hypothetical protein
MTKSHYFIQSTDSYSQRLSGERLNLKAWPEISIDVHGEAAGDEAAGEKFSRLAHDAGDGPEPQSLTQALEAEHRAKARP